jgi:hypothetical protein
MPGDARAHLAPLDRHPQLIADHGPLRGPCSDADLSPGPGSGLSPGGGFWPGIAVAVRLRLAIAGRLRVAVAGRPGSAIVSQVGQPGGHLVPVVVLERAGGVWPDLDLHAEPPVEPGVSAGQLRDLPLGLAHAPVSVFAVPAQITAG